MKLLILKLTCISVILGAFASPATAQSDTIPQLVDEFSATLCSDDLRQRVDLFLAKISDLPGSIGSVVITPGQSMPGRAIKYREVIAAHVRFRRFYPDRLVFSDRPFGDSLIQLWLIPKGVRLGEIVREPERISDTTLFDASEIVFNWENKGDFGGNWADEPCDFGLMFDQFASVLKTDKNTFAHLLYASSKSINHSRAKTAVNMAVSRLTELGIPSDRIKTSYRGARKHAELQLWVVPRNGNKPVFRMGVVPN
jgi:hypothetical protein